MDSLLFLHVKNSYLS